jgi:hypothetical protein
MATRVDRMNTIREKAFRQGGAPRWSRTVLTAEPRWNGHPAEEPWQDETPVPSLARRLEEDPSFLGRTLHWLFIKGGMATVLLLGLIVLGLVGGFLGGR